jgi:hypothetical protein
VREVITLEYIDGNGEVVVIEERAEESIPKCVACNYTGLPEDVPEDEE